MDSREQWDLHTRQLDMLREEAESQPLIGEFEPNFESLEKQYEGASDGFRQGIQILKNRKYTGFRRIRGDGNCFFRGFMFRLIEILVEKVRH